MDRTELARIATENALRQAERARTDLADLTNSSSQATYNVLAAPLRECADLLDQISGRLSRESLGKSGKETAS